MKSSSNLIAFFGHNSAEPAVRRRALAFQQAGFGVVGFMPHRGRASTPAPFPLIDLGETRDNAYLQRIASVFGGVRRASMAAKTLQKADLIYARNLDMLAIAVLTRRRLGLHIPIVYECLDVHHRLTGNSATAKALRRIEARLLAACSLVVVSSPRFDTEHFRRYYPGRYRSFLVENRLIGVDAIAPRPRTLRPPDPGRLRIGWFGNLRCRRSLTLLRSLAQSHPDSLTVELRGYPALSVFPDFETEIAGMANLRYHGRYRAPDDLGLIYEGVDLIWAGDWYEAGANSLWLLPNRIYEGGYFAKPALAPMGTQTAAWLARHDVGLLWDPDDDQSLTDTVDALLRDPARLQACQHRLMALPRDTFVEPASLMTGMFQLATRSDPRGPRTVSAKPRVPGLRR